MRAYSAAADARLRIEWRPIRGDEGEPVKQEVAFENVLTVVELRSGVLGHAAARKLDIAGWRLDEGVLRQGAVDVAAVLSVVWPTRPCLEPEVFALSRLAPLLAVCCGNIESALNFVDDSLQRWASGGERVIV